MKGNLFIISSPSGGGKGTLIRRAMEEIPRLSYSVSYTTRKKRDTEIAGSDYHFVSVSQFEELIEKGEFLEYARVHGNYYGTSRSAIEKETSAGNDVILEIDVQGAALVRAAAPEAVSVFILPPSFEVLYERLKSRKTESASDLELRLDNARSEVRQYKEFDFVVINDDLDAAVADLKSVISSRRLLRDRQTDAIRDILITFDTDLN